MERKQPLISYHVQLHGNGRNDVSYSWDLGEEPMKARILEKRRDLASMMLVYFFLYFHCI